MAAETAGGELPGPSSRTVVVWDALRQIIERSDPARALDVVDLGGGTGGFAVPLAGIGHRVTVVDASADALAICGRRAAEEGVAVRALQGDATDLTDLVGEASMDLVLCHSVLEYVEDPAAALSTVARVLRPGGTVSVLATNRTAAVVHRALARRFGEARHAIDDPDGRWGSADPMPRRFGTAEVTALMRDAGLEVGATHGIRVFTDLLLGEPIEGEPGAAEVLVELERMAAQRSDLLGMASLLHVLGWRSV